MPEGRLRKRFLDCSGMTMQDAESFGEGLAQQQRDVMFQIGDLVRYCEARWPDSYHQVFPEWCSPDMLARASAVSKAYPKEEDRELDATYTIYMRNANKPDRIERIRAAVESGLTSDEERNFSKKEYTIENKHRWLLAFDTHYFINRWYHSGCGVETALEVSKWIERTIERLKEKGATDSVCAFEGHGSFRKELTESWEDNYKGKRGPKDPELVGQIHLTRELLTKDGILCVSSDNYEADDVLASYSVQFPGNVTIISADKDLRQCLSDTCNILLDVKWTEDEEFGHIMPEYKWLTSKLHTEETGIRPEQWIDLQTLMGDSVDSITGAKGIGETGAKNLIIEFGDIESVMKAAKDNDERLMNMKRGNIMVQSLLEFESKLDVTRQLVTLKTNLELPTTTRIL